MLKTFLLSAVVATSLGLAASTGASAATINGLALGSAAEQTSNVQDVRWVRRCRNVRVCRVGPHGRRCHVNRICKRYWR